MKVLFAVNNESVSEAIVKKYQKDYKEIISYKNVYFFNAIIKEVQKDKSYDRIVISEDLEPFANNNYDTIDKFLFEKLDNISDEATDGSDKDPQIILICSDRRSKNDGLLVKLFGIGVYSALLDQDRSVEEVCRLINTPRTKKEAKAYYKIDVDDVTYQAENDTDVNETEIQNIIKHYKSLGKNEDKYVESFNNIANQYTDAQLRIIIKFLPLNVKAVLEERSAKYQEIVTFGDKQYKKRNTINNTVATKIRKPKKEKHTEIDNLKIDAIEKRINNPLTGKAIVIPSANKQAVSIDNGQTSKSVPEKQPNRTPQMADPMPAAQLPGLDDEPEVAGKRGRPKKVVEEPEAIAPVKRGRGRPKKVVEEPVNLYDISEEEEKPTDSYSMSEQVEEPVNLYDISEEKAEEPVNLFDIPQEDSSFSMRENSQAYEPRPEPIISEPRRQENIEHQIENTSYYRPNSNLDSVLSRDKKLVSFVGTTKNGTSFIVNNLGVLFSSMGINTAILDTTQNRNSYYIFTKNEESLRKIAYDSIPKLAQGRSEGIQVNKNLTVYTALPGDENPAFNIQEALNTLANTYSLVLIDCDFYTPIEYFASSQEIYLIQSMDVLTIQPLTSFLRDLKNRGVLAQEKLKVIINKAAKVRGLSEKVLVGGMAFYNDPSMSFMTELFKKDMVRITTIPFDLSVYEAYLETLVTCELSINRYPKTFMNSLKELAGVVYPLLNKQKYQPRQINYENRNNFSNDMNSTLERMKKRY